MRHTGMINLAHAMTIKKALAIFILSTVALTYAHAQIAKDISGVLDKCAKTLKAAGDIEAQYKATMFEGRDETGTAKGTICISGKKLRVDNGSTIVWFDGKTQWALSHANKEVNISEPTAEERYMMNPYSFIDIYKKGYTATMTTETVRGETCYCVNLLPTGKVGSFQAILLTINKRTMLPICIRTKGAGNRWTRISIYDLEKKRRFKSSMFRFNSGDYPGYDVVDLR